MKSIFAIITLLFTLSAQANPVPEFPFVIVTESLDLKVKPDFTKIRFSILAYEASSAKALLKLTNISTSVIKIINDHKIAIDNLQTTQIVKSTKRARTEDAYNLEILGYEVSQEFNLHLENLEKYTSLMNELVKLDGVQNIDAFFETSKEEEYKEKMIAELSAKARKKADTLAQAQLRKVKEVYGITTEGTFGQAYAVFSLEYDPQAYSLGMGADSYGMTLVMAVPEHIKVSQRITAIYKLK